jgi:GntR family transcriptional regulator/MocR family aminotransferase
MMSKQTGALPLAVIQLDRDDEKPLYQQIYECLGEAILNGQLVPGLRLPSTRDLADTLSVSRNTVMNAFEQLLAEGYLMAAVGSGTYVTHTLPDDLLQAKQTKPKSATPSPARKISTRGMLLAEKQASIPRIRNPQHVFAHGIPAVDAFPFDTWVRLTTRCYREADQDMFLYGDPSGYWALREAIATYLKAARAVTCEPEQVIICAGSQQALDLAARVLLDAGDTVWIEDPGYRGAQAAFGGADAKMIPVRVDDEGLDVEAGIETGTVARLIYVTPSHQFPLGVTMSLTRRLALLQWAAKNNAWVIEDDYDSEYRYAGRPLAALQGLDNDGRVIYLGTFSKVLFPALRIGYLIVPTDLVTAFTTAQSVFNRGISTVSQAVLAAFIEEGHLARHIRRMRVLYEERQAVFMEAAERFLGDYLRFGPIDTGMHTVGWLPEGVDDVSAYQKAAQVGIETLPLSSYAQGRLEHGGLVLGYAAVDVNHIAGGMKRLAKALLE